MNTIHWIIISIAFIVLVAISVVLIVLAAKGKLHLPRKAPKATKNTLPYFRFFAEEKQMFRKTRSAVTLTAEMAKRDPKTGEKVGTEKVAARKYLIVGGKEIPRPMIFLRPIDNLDDDSLEVAVLFYDGAPMTIEEVNSRDVATGEPD